MNVYSGDNLDEDEPHQEAHQEELEGQEMEDAVPDDLDGFQVHDSGDEDDADIPCPLNSTRVPVASERPEFKELSALGLTTKPAGCCVGVHPASRVWRAYTSDSKFFGRCWGGTTSRSPKQALLLVLMLMLSEHTKTNPSDRFAKKQLDRVRAACLEAGVAPSDMEAV